MDNIKMYPWRAGWRFQFAKALFMMICVFGLLLGICCSVKIAELHLFQNFPESSITGLSGIIPFVFCMYIAFRLLDYFEEKIEKKWWAKRM